MIDKINEEKICFYKCSEKLLKDPYFDDMFKYCLLNNQNLKLSHFNEEAERFYFITKQNLRICCDRNFWMIAGVFGKESYSPVFFYMQDNYIVIDFGMNRGYASLYFASDKHCTKVYGFEPCKNTFNFAKYNIDLNPDEAKKIKMYNIGLGNKNEKILLHKLKNHDESSSINLEQITLLNNNINAENLDNEIIEIKKASDIVRDIMKKHKDKKFVLKIDIEGAEKDVLEDLHVNNLIQNFEIVIGEVHNNYNIDKFFENYEKVSMVRENSNQYEFCFKQCTTE